MSADRVYALLPHVHREQDEIRGGVLHALLAVIGEQVDAVEGDIDRLYRNWFIETCEDWVVPYLGQLIGYRPLGSAGGARSRVLVPRREVANTIASRRRKGTIALLEELANQVAGWPARAVELYRLLGWTQHLDHLHPGRGGFVDLGDAASLKRLDGPFDRLPHTVDIRRVGSAHTPGRHNIPSIALFVWRLKAYSVSRTNAQRNGWKSPAGWTQANCVEDQGPNDYTFSVLGNDVRLYHRPLPEDDPSQVAGEENLPVPVGRRAFAGPKGHASKAVYGPGKSLVVWAPGWPRRDAEQPVPVKAVIPADLSQWSYDPPRDHIAIDPERGRIVFPSSQLPRHGVLVYYHYGFAADLGGGEYPRTLAQPRKTRVYRVGEGGEYKHIQEAFQTWQQDPEKPPSAVIEIMDSGVYTEPLTFHLEPKTTLQIRAGSGVRPVIRLLDYFADRPDGFGIRGGDGSRVTFDGLLIAGRGLQVVGPEIEDQETGDLCHLTIRHCTLVPGWALHHDCEPRRPGEPSLQLVHTRVGVTVEHSILGPIEVVSKVERRDPVAISVSDSIWDATSVTRTALSGPDETLAFARLTVKRSTVLGRVLTHGIALAENAIFTGRVEVARRHYGCIRFSYVPPGSRTPRRYACQPDKAAECLTGSGRAQAETSVRPQFKSVRYGTPTYAQLVDGGSAEIASGAEDESEMGTFHDLYTPQRTAILRARLEEYTAAGMEAGIVFAS